MEQKDPSIFKSQASLKKYMREKINSIGLCDSIQNILLKLKI